MPFKFELGVDNHSVEYEKCELDVWKTEICKSSANKIRHRNRGALWNVPLFENQGVRKLGRFRVLMFPGARPGRRPPRCPWPGGPQSGPSPPPPAPGSSTAPLGDTWGAGTEFPRGSQVTTGYMAHTVVPGAGVCFLKTDSR